VPVREGLVVDILSHENEKEETADGGLVLFGLLFICVRKK
jgi:hypothetical protein